MENSPQIQAELTQTQAVRPYRQASKVVMLQAPSGSGSPLGHPAGLVEVLPPELGLFVVQSQFAPSHVHWVLPYEQSRPSLVQALLVAGCDSGHDPAPAFAPPDPFQIEAPPVPSLLSWESL